jgi:hypothetical protein
MAVLIGKRMAISLFNAIQKVSSCSVSRTSASVNNSFSVFILYPYNWSTSIDHLYLRLFSILYCIPQRVITDAKKQVLLRFASVITSVGSSPGLFERIAFRTIRDHGSMRPDYSIGKVFTCFGQTVRSPV